MNLNRISPVRCNSFDTVVIRNRRRISGGCCLYAELTGNPSALVKRYLSNYSGCSVFVCVVHLMNQKFKHACRILNALGEKMWLIVWFWIREKCNDYIGNFCLLGESVATHASDAGKMKNDNRYLMCLLPNVRIWVRSDKEYHPRF